MRKLYELLKSQVDAGDWWPAGTDFEIIVGTVLTQNTAWTNVLKALANLEAAGITEPAHFRAVDLDELKELIRPAGYYNTKAGYLKNVTEWFIERAALAPETPTEQLRAELLQIKGIGSESADDIVLYVYRRPVFIYDTYSRRLLKAAGFGDFRTYEQAKKALDPQVADAGFTVAELGDFHGMIVEAGKIANTHPGKWETAWELLQAGELKPAR